MVCKLQAQTPLPTPATTHPARCAQAELGEIPRAETKPAEIPVVVVSGTATPPKVDAESLLASEGFVIKQNMKDCCRDCSGCQPNFQWTVHSYSPTYAETQAFPTVMFVQEEAPCCQRCCSCAAPGCRKTTYTVHDGVRVAEFYPLHPISYPPTQPPTRLPPLAVLRGETCPLFASSHRPHRSGRHKWGGVDDTLQAQNVRSDSPRDGHGRRTSLLPHVLLLATDGDSRHVRKAARQDTVLL